MKRNSPKRPDLWASHDLHMRGDDGPGVWFSLWFAFCALMAIAFVGGLVWLVIALLPHVIGFLDRVGH